METRRQTLVRKLHLNHWRRSREAKLDAFMNDLSIKTGYVADSKTIITGEEAYQFLYPGTNPGEKPECITSPFLSEYELRNACTVLCESLEEQPMYFWFYSHEYAGIFSGSLRWLLGAAFELVHLDGDGVFSRAASDPTCTLSMDFGTGQYDNGYQISVGGRPFLKNLTLRSESYYGKWI